MSRSEKPSGHTPGPWLVVVGDDDDITVCAFEGDPRDGIMADIVAEILSVENEADAQLIAAAPDLLEALRLVLGVVAPEGGGSAFIASGTERIARAAIVKAEERS
jgi:hypothetical protein